MRIALFFFLIGFSASGYDVASTNRYQWYGNVGIPGGIPYRTTIYTSLPTSVSAANIDSALANCPSNQVVLLTNGTFNIGNLDLVHQRSGKTLRGHGPGQTIINSSATSAAISFEDRGFNATGDNLASGYTMGSTQIVTSATPNADLVAGNLMRIEAADDTNFVYATTGVGRHLGTIHKVLTQVGTTVTFTPPLVWDYTGLTPKVFAMGGGPGIDNFGIEDLTIIDGGVSQDLIFIKSAWRCWVSNVEITNHADVAIFMINSCQIEITRCYVHDMLAFPNGTDGDGILPADQTSFCLFSFNMFKKVGNPFLYETGGGHVCIYNVCTNNNFSGSTHVTEDYNANHGPHSMMNLWEGNIGQKWKQDSYHGSTSHLTLFRNWFPGNWSSASPSDWKICIDMNRGAYFCSIIGNILGDASWTNDTGFAYTGTQDVGYSSQNWIYRFGFPNTGNTGTNEVVPDNAWGEVPGDGYNKFHFITNVYAPYPDKDVTNKITLHGNYDYATHSQLWDIPVTLSDHVLSNSFYYPVKPTNFGFLPWPPFDPSNPLAANITNSPAGYLFVFGTNAPAGQQGGGGGGTDAKSGGGSQLLGRRSRGGGFRP